MDLSPERTGHADFYHPARTITGGSIYHLFFPWWKTNWKNRN